VNDRPRLPTVANLAYDPPVARPKAPPPMVVAGELSDDQEATTALVSLLAPFTEQSVYKTKRRWQACDVYVAMPPFVLKNTTGWLVVAIYAVVKNVRTLVATGRINLAVDGGVDKPAIKWIAAARAEANTWEVTCLLDGEASGLAPPNPPTVQVSVIATDHANDVPEWLGLAANGVGVMLGATTSVKAVTAGIRLQLGSILAVAAANAPRYLIVNDSEVALVNGNAAEHTFGVGAVGSTLLVEGGLLKARRFRNGISLAISSTPLTVTLAAANDVVWKYFYR